MFKMPEKPKVDAPKESNDKPESTPQNNPPAPKSTQEQLSDLRKEVEKGK